MYGSQQVGRRTHSHTQSEHAQTHTHTAASAARIPNVRSSTTERSKWCIKCSHATTNLIHYRLASILMITGGSSPESQLTGRDVRGKEREKTGTGKKLERTRFFPFPFLQILTSANLYCQLCAPISLSSDTCFLFCFLLRIALFFTRL